jgi:hypothetical protein
MHLCDCDSDAVWSLVGLTRWVIAFIEKMMRGCVKSCEMHLLEIANDSSNDLFGANPRMFPICFLYVKVFGYGSV